jgi:hypothetical protein
LILLPNGSIPNFVKSREGISHPSGVILQFESARRGNSGAILGVALTFECKEPAMYAKECGLGG